MSGWYTRLIMLLWSCCHHAHFSFFADVRMTVSRCLLQREPGLFHGKQRLMLTGLHRLWDSCLLGILDRSWLLLTHTLPWVFSNCFSQRAPWKTCATTQMLRLPGQLQRAASTSGQMSVLMSCTTTSDSYSTWPRWRWAPSLTTGGRTAFSLYLFPPQLCHGTDTAPFHGMCTWVTQTQTRRTTERGAQPNMTVCSGSNPSWTLFV